MKTTEEPEAYAAAESAESRRNRFSTLSFCLHVRFSIGERGKAKAIFELFDKMRGGGIGQFFGDLRHGEIAVYEVFRRFFQPEAIDIRRRRFAVCRFESFPEIFGRNIAKPR